MLESGPWIRRPVIRTPSPFHVEQRAVGKRAREQARAARAAAPTPARERGVGRDDERVVAAIRGAQSAAHRQSTSASVSSRNTRDRSQRRRRHRWSVTLLGRRPAAPRGARRRCARRSRAAARYCRNPSPHPAGASRCWTMPRTIVAMIADDGLGERRIVKYNAVAAGLVQRGRRHAGEPGVGTSRVAGRQGGMLPGVPATVCTAVACGWAAPRSSASMAAAASRIGTIRVRATFITPPSVPAPRLRCAMPPDRRSHKAA